MPSDKPISDPTPAGLQAQAATAGLIRILEQVSADIRAATKPLTRLNLDKAIERWLTAQERLLPILAQRGWVPNMHLQPRDMVELLELYKKRGGEAVDQRMVELCRADCLRSITALTAGVFASWAPVYSKAARAHQAGDYELAIPIWLVSIEGIVHVALGERNLFKHVRSKKVQARVAERLRIKGSAFSQFSDAWVQAVQTVALATEKADAAILNRNAILHGQVPWIGSERDSIQGMLFLDLLDFLLETAPRRRLTAKAKVEGSGVTRQEVRVRTRTSLAPRATGR